MRVLILRISAMGDVAMCAPVLSAACKAYPNVQFDVLTTTFYTPFFEQLPNLRVIGTNIKKDKSGFKGLCKLYRQLSSETKYDKVIDLHDVLRTKVLRILFAMSGISTIKIDKGRCDKKRLTADTNKVFKPLKTTIQRYTETFTKAGLPFIVDNKQDKKPLPAPFAEYKGQFVGIAPFAQHAGKIYPIDKMREVVRILNERNDTTLFVFGGGTKEKNIAETWEKEFKNCVSVIGKVKLAEELALISNLDYMISMDSSAMHMASLYGVKVISIWGATHPYAGFMGYGQDDKMAVQLDLPCRPCSIYGNKPCKYGDYRCFDISPEEITKRIN